MTLAADYFGKGLAFPFRVDHMGGIALSVGSDDVDMSIHLILSTAPGERVMRPNFGCAVWDHVFAPINASTLGRMEDAVKFALMQWEPRMEVEGVEAVRDEHDETRVLISIDYTVRATNDRRNLVYPFYVIPEGGEA